MKFLHFIRAAPFEFSLYGFAVLAIIALVGGLVVHFYADDIPFLYYSSSVVVILAYIFGMPLAFFACAFAPLILLFRRLVWRKRRAFCIYEFVMHLIIALPLTATVWHLFSAMTKAA